MNSPPFFGDQVQHAIGRIYAGIADPARFPAAFDRAAELCGAKGMLIGPLVPQATPVPGLVAYASEAFHEAIPEYVSEFLAINPRKNWLTRNRITDLVFSDNDLLTDEELNADPFYNEFLRKHGNLRSCDRVASGVIEGGSLWISAQYSSRAGAPERPQRGLFELLSGHIAQAIGISRLLHQDRARAVSVEALIEAYGCAALIVDHNAGIVCMNDRARALHGRGLSYKGGQLTATSPREGPAFLRFLRNAASPAGPASGPSLLRLASPLDGTALLLRASPVSSSDGPLPVIDALERRGWILVIAESLAPAGEPAIELPLRLLGLTPAEARIAALIGMGLSPDEAALRQGVAVSTVRLHLRRVYEKLAINRQAELARIVTRLENFSFVRK